MITPPRRGFEREVNKIIPDRIWVEALNSNVDVTGWKKDIAHAFQKAYEEGIAEGWKQSEVPRARAEGYEEK